MFIKRTHPFKDFYSSLLPLLILEITTAFRMIPLKNIDDIVNFCCYSVFVS
jgi:hypothetical protein